MENEYLSVDQVAKVLKRSGTTIRMFLRNELLPGRKFGRDWIIKKEDLDEFVLPRRGRPVKGERIVGRALYFIQAGEGGPIKIGTTLNVRQRLGKLQADNPVELSVLAAFEGTKSQEMTIQRNFAHLCIRGEWYRPDKELLSFIEENDDSEGEE